MIKKLRKQFDNIVLTKEETNKMRSHLLTYTKENPAEVRNKEESRRTTSKPHGLLTLFLTKRLMFVSIILALVAMLGGGTAFAAETTIPGDLLYPVKVHINENVRVALAGSTEAKAELEARFAERRLEEAAELEQSGKLKTDVVTRLENNFSAHVDRVEQHITKLTEEGKLEAAAAQDRLETSIRVHQTILEKLRAKRIEVKERLDAKTKAGEHNTTSTANDDDENEDENDSATSTDDGSSSTTTPKLPLVRPVDKILRALEHRLDVQKEVREKIGERLQQSGEEKIKEAAQNAKKVAEKQMEETGKMIARFVEKQGPQPRAQAEFNAAVAVKTSADTKLDNGKFREAFELYHKAQRMMLNAKMMLQEKFDTEVNVGADDDADEQLVDEQKNKEEDKGEQSNGRKEKIKIKVDEKGKIKVDVKERDTKAEGRGKLNLGIGVN